MDKKAKERVAIAKDALEWLKAGALIAAHAGYVYPERQPTYEELCSGKQLRDVVLGKCMVCALGSLFIAKAVRFDQVLANEWNLGASNTTDGALTQHFSTDQLKLIERCFEGWADGGKYCARYPNPKARLTAILQNIIDNKGTFVPNYT